MSAGNERKVVGATAQVLDFIELYDHTNDEIEALLTLHLDMQHGWVGLTHAEGDVIDHSDMTWLRYPRDAGDVIRYIRRRDPCSVRLTPRLHVHADRPHDWGKVRLTNWMPQQPGRWGGSEEVRSSQGGPDLTPKIEARPSNRPISTPLALIRNGNFAYNDDNVETPYQSLTVTTASEVTPRRVGWLWQDRIPLGMTTILDGDPGVGKSTLTIDIAARVTTGCSFPDGALGIEPADVVILSCEDDPSTTIVPRLIAAGADLNRVWFVEGPRDEYGNPRLIALPGDVQRLREVVQRYRAKLIIIDPLVAYYDPKTDNYRDQQVRPAMSALKSLAEEEDCAVVMVRHLNKTGGVKAIYRGGGSIGVIASVRAGLFVAPHPELPDTVVLAQSKLNVAKKPKSLVYSIVASNDGHCGRVEWQGESDLSADELMVEGTDHRRDPRDAARELILRAIDDGGGRCETKKLEELAEQQGISTKGGAWRRAFNELRDEGTIRSKRIDKFWGWVRT